MKRNFLALGAVAAVAVPLLASPASAQTFTYGSVSETIILNTSSPIVNEGAGAGGFVPSSPPSITNQVGTVYWCVDIPDTLNGNAYSSAGALPANFKANGSTITLGSNLNTVANLNKLIYNGENYLTANLSGGQNANVSAALSIAVWALLYDPSSTGWTASALANASGVTNASNPFTVKEASTATDLVDAAAFLACLSSTNSLCTTAWGASPDTLLAVTQSGGQELAILRLWHAAAL